MKRVIAVLVGLVLLLGGGYFGVVGWAKHKASGLSLASLEPAGSSVVLADDGKQVIGRFASAEAGKPLDGKQVSALVRQAHMAAEDRGFYSHGPISAWSMGVALITKRGKAGGSTITQQLAKRYAGDERTLERKLNELPYAYRLEQDYTKDQILVKYVNANYYGRGAYGIEDAAQTWFGVSAVKLTDMNDPLQVARAAFLAGLVKAPSDYDDYDPKQGKPSQLKYEKVVRERTIYVLDGLRDLKELPAGQTMVSQKVVDQAKALIGENLSALKLTDTVKGSGSATQGDPFVMNYIRDWLVAWQTEIAKKGGLDEAAAQKEGQTQAEALLARGGLKLKTDINASAQARLVSAHHAELGKGPSGMVALNPRTGGVVAMSGGRDYGSDPFNYAMYAARPPGSTVKAFVLADLVSKGISVKSQFAAPSYIKIDGPEIWDHTRADAPGCKLTLEDALAVSNNVVFIEAITGKMASCQDRGKLTDIKDNPTSPASVAALLRKAGAETSPVPNRTSPIKIGEAPRLGIGDTLEVSPLKLAVMASTLSTGEYHKPYVVRQIDASNGETIFERTEESKRVLDEKTVNIVNQALTGVFTRGTARGAQVDNHRLAGKTGTTDEEQADSWIFAYNANNPKAQKEPAYMCAGWAGKNPNLQGADVGKVCQNFYQGVLKGRPNVDFPAADMNSGKLIGLNTKAAPPPTTAPAPTSSKATVRTSTPPKQPTSAPSGVRPSPTGRANTNTNRSVPPPENGDGTNTGTVEVPGVLPT